MEKSGVTRREFDLIKKLLKLDPEIFSVRIGPETSPYMYTVDLSKYQNIIPCGIFDKGVTNLKEINNQNYSELSDILINNFSKNLET